MRRQTGHLAPPDSDVLEQLRIRNPHWAQQIEQALEAVGTPRR
jgi:hypothetical protein